MRRRWLSEKGKGKQAVLPLTEAVLEGDVLNGGRASPGGFLIRDLTLLRFEEYRARK